jgi:hypothetical protein
MARSTHATYTAAERYERRATRRQTPRERRQGTRRAVVLAAIREA